MDTSLKMDGSSKKQVLLSACIFMGLSHIIYLKQYIKGAIFALIEIIMIVNSPSLFTKIKDMIEISRWWKGISPAYFRLIDGIIALCVLAIFIVAYVVSIKSAVSSYNDFCLEGRVKSQKESMQGAVGKAFPIFGLTPAFILIVFFVIVPLLFSVVTGFTNWDEMDGHSSPGAPVNWVGFKNFADMFGGDSSWTSAFGRVAVWTVIWGAMATITCYFGGMVLATLLYEAKLKVTPVFRAILILPYAIPSILTVKVWQYMLNGSTGVINNALKDLHLISESVPWMTDKTIVKFVCIGVNMWVGIPYFMLLITGQMTAISADIYEAAEIDGANKLQVFSNITLPLVIYQTAPLIIMSFTHNINNFGAIYFLTGGDPKVTDTTSTSAGATDLLITWIYKLTMDQKRYCRGSVLAMLVFIVLAPFAIWNFKNTKSYKEGEL